MRKLILSRKIGVIFPRQTGIEARRVVESAVPMIPDEVWRAGSEHTCDCQTGRHSPDVGPTRWPDDAVRQDYRGTAFETTDDSVLRIQSGHLP